jgi:hypothetical protein
VVKVDTSATWIDSLFNNERQMLSPALGGKLRLRLYFRYLCNLDPLLRIISAVGETFQCTQISLILHNTEFLHFVVGRLGLDSYSHEPRTLASWSMTTGWKIDILATKHGRAEKMLGQDPFAADADNDVHQVDWAMAEDGDYDGMQGSGWDIDELMVGQSCGEWDGDRERISADDDIQEGSSWKVDDSAAALIGTE